MFLKYAVGAGTALAISIVGVSGPALAKVEGENDLSNPSYSDPEKKV